MKEKQSKQNNDLSQTADSQKAPVEISLSKLEALIKKCAPNYKDLGVSLIMDGNAAYTILVNAGHGGLEPDWEKTYKELLAQGKQGEIHKKYTTWQTGDGKLFRHGQKAGRNWQLNPHPNIAGATADFHAAGWFFEGVENRKYIDSMVNSLKPYVDAGVLNIVVMSHEWKDTSRGLRIRLANAIFSAQKRQNPKSRAFWLGWHFNAANSNANGICIFTSVGQTHSDKVAEVCLNNFDALGFPLFNLEAARNGIPQVATIRVQRADGDKDHEANFDEVRLTDMPGMLGEFGFFDNRIDANRIFYDDEYKRICIEAVTKAIVADAKGEIK